MHATMMNVKPGPAPALRSGKNRFAALVLLMAMAVLFLAASATTPKAEDYLLGPQDEVRLKVFEWRASRDVFFEWDALNDSFRVGPDGTLNLPFAGTVHAEGLSASELSARIGEALRSRMRLGRSPDVSAEVVAFRPFYVMGDVAQPGEFAYRPGMTALQAVTIAGGLTRATDTRLQREVIEGRGELARQTTTRFGLLARKARLVAEADGAGAISFPAELTSRQDDPEISILLKQERDIFDARQSGLRNEARALEELRDFLTEAVKSLESHVEFQDKQVKLATDTLANTESLVKKGFASEARKMEVEGALVRAQSDRLTAETSLLRARQEKSQAEISRLQLLNRHENEVRADLRETQGQLEEVEQSSATTVQLLNESESAADLAPARGATALDPVYTVVRDTGGKSVTMEIAETDRLKPGDTLKVDIPVELTTTKAPGGTDSQM